MKISFLPEQLQNDDTLIWRYMKLSTFFLLLDGTAFFPSIATLQSDDPLEGGLHIDPIWLNGKLEDFSEIHYRRLKKWLLCKATKDERKLYELNHDNGAHLSNIIANLYARELAKRRAAWCWFQSEFESNGMWSIYGCNGVAIKTRTSALQKSLPKNRAFQITEIQYVTRDPGSPYGFNTESHRNQSRTYRPHLIKGKEYSSENELRVVTSCSGSARGTFVRNICIDNLIQEVVISPRLPFEEAKAVEQQIKKHSRGQHLNVSISSLIGERRQAGFELDFALSEHFGKEGEFGLPSLMKAL